MARRLRHDCPGAEFHVMNRGIARRTIFDAPADYRFFLSCLAKAVRRREITVLAYALMRTHFHLFVRSHGGLSTAMRRVQLRHVRRFNRLRRRDGPLLRNRFLSKRVRSHAYGRNVVHYTHENPVLARLCSDPTEYPWSSAWLCTRPKVPLWFSPAAIDRYGIDKRPGWRAPSERVMQARAELLDARLRSRAAEDDMPLDAATPERVRDWMAHMYSTTRAGVRSARRSSLRRPSSRSSRKSSSRLASDSFSSRRSSSSSRALRTACSALPSLDSTWSRLCGASAIAAPRAR